MNSDIVTGAFEALRRRDVDWILERLSPSIAGMLDANALRAAIDSIVGAFGEPVRAAEPVAVGGEALGQFSLDCEAERGEFVMMVSVADGLITGLNVVPKVEHPRPSYAPEPGDVTERALSFAADPAFPLEGVLATPAGDGPWPVVVLVHGSGPNDRDETAFGAKPFLDLALGLAARGVATFRYDKRTRTYGRKVDLNVRAEVVDDAVAAIDTVAAIEACGPVFVLGHSLGGTLAPAIAAERSDDVAGVILVAGATRPIRDAVREQVEHLLALTPEGPNRAPLEQLRTDVDTKEDLLGVPASYWEDLEAHGPDRLAPSMRLPALVLQGERDYQVTMADFAGWKALLPPNPATRYITYPELNHLLAAGSGVSGPDEYMRPSNVDVRVVDDIAAWITAVS